MIVYFVRHGESEANAAHVHSGWSPVSLTEKGKKDALRAKRFLEGKRIDRVFSSDTVRARETAALVLPDRTPELSPLLREIGVGDLAGKSVEQCAEEFGERYLLAREKKDFREFGGESGEEHWARAVEFLRALEKEGEETVVAFSHEGTIRRLYYYATRLPYDPKGVACKNGGVCVFVYENGAWRIEGWDLPSEPSI